MRAAPPAARRRRAAGGEDPLGPVGVRGRPADGEGVTGSSPDERLRRLEAAARARARGERVVVPDARASGCEVCGRAGVAWGALCDDCRARLASGRGRSG